MGRSFKRSHREKGATLIVALIILLIMSLIGISNMQSSTMQERMAANNRQKTVSLFAADSALKAAENWFSDNIERTEDLSKFDGSSGLYSLIASPGTVVAKPLSSSIPDISDPISWSSYGVSSYKGKDIVDSTIVSKQPKYVIEYIGRDWGTAKNVASEVNSDTKGEGKTNAYMFRITAIGWGKDENIYTVLESVFRTGSNQYFTY
ncbi:pilus assembly PilX family protein [Teredinibacter haidensis]|uniref:pilus assembly PilX family protein n=1 Tax=Teredinibacter haidensis TaxID=2731755 RepID=UPI000948F853|nr:PilX N-terminal domain-containing pilus assembly protein [Teredinibacter haidensis]